ncbi:hypothetical protein ACHMWN_00560 [Pedobacter sp. UC225_61]|uniref:hypothetical protein n=1 Tax=Pedobacter sp. UC225_61 TaxID=3374623 RepID=UPI0037B07B4A
MKLTDEQKAEIKDYIITVPKYRETYNELFDHIVNSFEDSKVTFSIDEVINIVNKDFGGFSEIVYQEKSYQKELSKQYNKGFRMEMVNSFRWPNIFNNLIVLALCLTLYCNKKGLLFNIKPIILSSIGCCILVAAFGFTIILKNKYQYSKYSILDNYFGYSCSFGFIMVNGIFSNFLGKSSLFEISANTKLIIALSLFFFSSVYVRAFIKFYNQKLKVLTK